MGPGNARSATSGPVPIIGIAGGTGSGKTTITAAIQAAVGPGRVTLISHDSYYRDRPDLAPADRANLNFDHPDSLETELLAEHLDRLAAGEAIDAPSYDFVHHRRLSQTERIEPRDVILVEGVLVLADSLLRERMSLCIYVETDDDIRFIRRLKRDVEERGRTMQSVVSQYLATVRPMHLQFVGPSRSFADVIIPEGGYNARAIEMICSQIRSLASVDQRRNEPDAD
jgi:uridine kinase